MSTHAAPDKWSDAREMGTLSRLDRAILHNKSNES